MAIAGRTHAGSLMSVAGQVVEERRHLEVAHVDALVGGVVLLTAGALVLGCVDDAYWLDLGTPEKYLRAHFDMLEGRVHGVDYPAPWIGEGADVDLRAHLGRWVAVGPGAVVVFAGQIHSAREARKIHTSAVDAFGSPGYGPIGHVEAEPAHPLYARQWAFELPRSYRERLRSGIPGLRIVLLDVPSAIAARLIPLTTASSGSPSWLRKICVGSGSQKAAKKSTFPSAATRRSPCSR